MGAAGRTPSGDAGYAAGGAPRRGPAGAGPQELQELEELEQLVRRHQGMVWRYLRLLGADPDEADDLMQETFLRIGAARREPVAAPAAFLRGIARNLLIAARRAQRRRTPTREWTAAVDELAADEPAAFDDARMEALRRCLLRLRGRGRRAVELHHVDGLSYRSAAERLGIGVHGFKTLLDRARRALRLCVRQHMEGDLER